MDRTVADLQDSEFSKFPLEAISPLLLRELQNCSDGITYQFIVEADLQGSIASAISLDFVDQSAPTFGPRFACQVFWRSNGEEFGESRSQRIHLPIGVDRQHIDFILPKGLVQRLRFDPSDQKGFLHLYAMRLFPQRLDYQGDSLQSKKIC